jgi:hypothetical protein
MQLENALYIDNNIQQNAKKMSSPKMRKPLVKILEVHSPTATSMKPKKHMFHRSGNNYSTIGEFGHKTLN